MGAVEAFGPGRPSVAFGPKAPGWGSWDWVGADLAAALGKDFRTSTFAAWESPRCDAVVVVKHPPPPGWLEQVGRSAAVVYCPVDAFGGAAEVDAASVWLRRCDRVVVHCERLRKYFEPYARVEYMDHHVKFVTPPREEYRATGDLLWVGVRSNLPPLAEWVNAHPLPCPLDVVSNWEVPGSCPSAVDLGFRPGVSVRLHEWSPARHLGLAASARGALDVKGCDFRARHKPPAKGLDFLASGVPLAMNRDSSTAEHLGRMGFEVADPRDADWWLSREYWEETRRFGLAVRELLSPSRVARRFGRVLDAVLAERRGGVVR